MKHTWLRMIMGILAQVNISTIGGAASGYAGWHLGGETGLIIGLLLGVPNFIILGAAACYWILGE